MLYKDLLQAKKEGRPVSTSKGVGELNGIGLASSYVAFPDPHPDIECVLLLFDNEDIHEVEEIYDILPMTERTLLKRYKDYLFKIANDRGEPCAWYIYKGEEPIAVVHYYKGHKLVMHRIR